MALCFFYYCTLGSRGCVTLLLARIFSYLVRRVIKRWPSWFWAIHMYAPVSTRNHQSSIMSLLYFFQHTALHRTINPSRSQGLECSLLVESAQLTVQVFVRFAFAELRRSRSRFATAICACLSACAYRLLLLHAGAPRWIMLATRLQKRHALRRAYDVLTSA